MYLAPVVVTGNGTFSGATQTIPLATVPSGNRAYALIGVTITSSGTNVLATIQDNASPTPNVGFEAILIEDVPILTSYESVHFQPGAVISLVLASGSGSFAYTVSFKPA